MKKITHYKIEEKLGSGGMGVVFKAFDTVLERNVALKLMHKHLLDDPKNAKRFLREARAAAKLTHPNIVSIYEIGDCDEGKFIVMEYVHGVPLTNIIDDSKSLKIERALKLTIQICSGVSKAHELGIMHRDIKTDNILITPDDTIKILDFGIAKMGNDMKLTSANEILGTVDYMPPEQMLGEKTDFSSDIYSVGVVCYELLTSKLPFNGESAVEIVYKKLNEEPIPPSFYDKNIENEVDKIVLKAISHQKDVRFETAQAFSQSLEDLLNLKQIELPEEKPGISLDDAGEEQLTKDLNSLRTIFVGRSREFQKLIKVFHSAKQKKGQTVIINGEAGIGKTRLANQLKGYASHHNSIVLYGACLYQEGMDA
jgi:serine/threonine-protein kinase